MSDPTDYTQYTIPELEDARRFVDIERYPDRAAALDAELERRRGLGGDAAGGSFGAAGLDADAYGGAQAASQPSVGLKRLLSIPFFGLAVLVLLPFSWMWLVLVHSSETGPLPTVLFGGVGFGCAMAGLLLWERRYRPVIAGVFLVGLGAWVALLVAGMALTTFAGTLGPPLTEAVDPIETKRILWGGSTSAVLLLASGIHALVGAVRRRRSNHDRGPNHRGPR